MKRKTLKISAEEMTKEESKKTVLKSSEITLTCNCKETKCTIDITKPTDSEKKTCLAISELTFPEDSN